MLPSGLGTVGHRPGCGGDVEWLQGGAASYRLAALRGRSFDERLHGVSWGEDLDFSFRLGRDHRLCICPTALTRHGMSPLQHRSPRSVTRERVPVQHRWVVENRRHGMRRTAFWWSVAGELLLRGTGAALSRGPDGARHRETVRGMLDGIADVLTGRARS